MNYFIVRPLLQKTHTHNIKTDKYSIIVFCKSVTIKMSKVPSFLISILHLTLTTDLKGAHNHNNISYRPRSNI